MAYNRSSRRSKAAADAPVSARRGASHSATTGTDRIRAYVIAHMQSVVSSLGQISRTPFASFMTIAVIAIALAMPTALHLLLKNLQGVSADWDNAAQISLFLNPSVPAPQIQQLRQQLQAMPEIDIVNEITPEQALQEFRQLSDFNEALQALTENPFPTVLIVQPVEQYSAPAAAESLLTRLRDLAGVDMAQLDLDWVKRWYALMEIGKRAVMILAFLLSLAVLLIIGNTIRLAIQNHRDEIEVQKLIGATDRFICRPFLYSGFWHGLIGAGFAWLLVNLAVLLLRGPVQNFSLLYDNQFSLEILGLGATILLVIAGAMLGFVGARLAVGRHLREIEPS